MKRSVIALLAGLVMSALALSTIAPATAAGPKPTTSWTTSVQLGTPVNCSFPVTFTWAGFSGSNDTAAVWMADSLNGTVTGVFDQAKVRGASGSVTHTFDGLIHGALYRAWGELLDSHGNAILGSLDFSSYGMC